MYQSELISFILIA
jgi:hypothetical protein